MNPIPTTPRPCDIVAFAAHPDDAEINCGGTLALAVELGWSAGIVDFTRGELGTRGTPEERAREADEAARILGLSCRLSLALPDGHLEDGSAARRLVVEALRALRPRVVLAPPLEDHHPDHAAAGKVLARSVYLAGIEKYCPGLEPWRPHALLHYLGSRAAVPRLVVDVSRVFEKRMAAVRCHRSQLHRPGAQERPTRISNPEFLPWLEGTLRRHGFLIGARYGEAYTSAEPVPIQDPVRQFARSPWEEPLAGS